MKYLYFSIILFNLKFLNFRLSMLMLKIYTKGTIARRQFMRGTDPTKSKWVCLKYLHICKDCFTFCILFLIND